MRHEKKIHMIYNIFETNPFIFHPFQQLNYSLGALEREREMYLVWNEK